MVDTLTIVDSIDTYVFRTIEEKSGALAKILLGIGECTGKRVILKINQPSSDEAKLVTAIRMLGDTKKCLVPIILQHVPDNQLKSFFEGSLVHIEECAPGASLETIYLQNASKKDRGITENNRLYIAIQAAELFETCNQNGYVYLDHKPADHIFWDSDLRSVKVIDWNAAHANATPEELMDDYRKFCVALPQILNPKAYIRVLQNDTYGVDYELHPAALSFPSSSKHLNTDPLGYGVWTILILASLSQLIPVYGVWGDLIFDLKTVQSQGITTIGLEKIREKVGNGLYEHIRLIEQLQTRFFQSSAKDDDDNEWLNILKLADEKSSQASRAGLLKLGSDLEMALYSFLLARLLSPSNLFIYCSYELMRVMVALGNASEDITKLIELLNISRDGAVWEAFSKQCGELIKKSSLNETLLRVLRKLEKLSSAQAALANAKNAVDLHERLRFLEKAAKEDPVFSPILSEITITRSQIEQEQNLSEQLSKIEELLCIENADNWKQANILLQGLAAVTIPFEQQGRLNRLKRSDEAIKQRLDAAERMRKNFLEAFTSWDDKIISNAINTIITEGPLFATNSAEWMKLLQDRRNHLAKIHSLILKSEQELDLQRKLKFLQDAWELDNTYPSLNEKITNTQLEINQARINAFCVATNKMPINQGDITCGMKLCSEYAGLKNEYVSITTLCTAPANLLEKAKSSLEEYRENAQSSINGLIRALIAARRTSEARELFEKAKEVGLA